MNKNGSFFQVKDQRLGHFLNGAQIQMAFVQYKDLTTFGDKHGLLVASESNSQEQDHDVYLSNASYPVVTNSRSRSASTVSNETPNQSRSAGVQGASNEETTTLSRERSRSIRPHLMFEDPKATSPLHQQCVSEPNSEDSKPHSQESSKSIIIASNNHVLKSSFMETLKTKSLRLLNNLNPFSPSQKLSSTDRVFILVPPIDSGLMTVDTGKQECCQFRDKIAIQTTRLKKELEICALRHYAPQTSDEDTTTTPVIDSEENAMNEWYNSPFILQKYNALQLASPTRA